MEKKSKFNLNPFTKTLETNSSAFVYNNEKHGYYNYDYVKLACTGFKTWPSVWIYSMKENLDMIALKTTLLEKGGKLFFSIQEDSRPMELGIQLDNVIVVLKYKGMVSFKELEDETDTLDKLACNIEVLHHPLSDEWKEINELCKENVIKTREETTVWTLCLDNGQLAIANMSLPKIDLLEDLDLAYGTGALEYANELITVMNARKKGIILFQGASGTGKSTYARILLPRFLKELDKNIVIIPAGMQNYLSSPDLLPFLHDYFLQISEEDGDPLKSGILLLVEEAGSIMTGSERTSAISNMLSIADGYFTDVPEVQIMGILNDSLDKLDPALLRPRRLISKRVFTKLSKEDSQRLATHLNKPLENLLELTPAEIFEWVEMGVLPQSKKISPLHEKEVKKAK
jgi:hypothetical protein